MESFHYCVIRDSFFFFFFLHVTNLIQTTFNKNWIYWMQGLPHRLKKSSGRIRATWESWGAGILRSFPQDTIFLNYPLKVNGISQSLKWKHYPKFLLLITFNESPKLVLSTSTRLPFPSLSPPHWSSWPGLCHPCPDCVVSECGLSPTVAYLCEAAQLELPKIQRWECAP